MLCSKEQLEEIRLLSQFNLTSTATGGIKVHAGEASPELVAAAKRLFDKGLTDHTDGGYLTSRGVEAAEHAQSLLRLLA
ncbi:MAG: TIGR02647 family protein [Proteobacteria bacterium]|nr:MAG: TIGR02647 family protein [Pseudomonadota bacterium]